MELRREELVRRGGELRALLATGSFKLVVDILNEEYQTTFFTTKPEDFEKREEAYRKHSALNDLIATMNSLIQIADADAQEDANDLEGDYHDNI